MAKLVSALSQRLPKLIATDEFMNEHSITAVHRN